MYLEKMKIIHFRKFNKKDNEVVFYNNQVVNGEIDISNISTLIVGQNNAGKSTIFKAFELLTSNGMVTSRDFNYDYLIAYIKDVIADNRDDNGEIKCPFMCFEFNIDLSDNDNENITQAISLIQLSSIENKKCKGLLSIYIRLKDENLFKKFIENEINNYTAKNSNDGNSNSIELRNLLKKITNKIDEIGFTYDYYNSQKKIEFKFADLFNFKLVDALSVDDECVLSKQFKSILKYHFSKGNILATQEIDNEINELNKKVEDLLEDKPTEFINTLIDNIVSANRVQMNLQGALTFENILDYSVKYFYSESDFYIPEDHFGLGYTKLVSIVANLLEYIEKKPEKNFDNKISIIAIEEPETFMHPQLQKCFIENINDVLNKILKESDKELKCQLVISTHSSHIVSNKIELSNSINNINYFGVINNKTKIALLEDSLFKTTNNTAFNNIKKHMSMNFAEALFADAVILVEGFAEEKIIPYFLTNYSKLKNRYITIVNIRGAHGFIFEKLLKTLHIPTVIVTDVDFISSDDNQIENYKNQKTSNETIIKFNGSDDLSNLNDCKLDVNDCCSLKVFVQEQENGYCGTSFEEGLIIANYDNIIIINVLKEMHSRKIKDILSFDKEGNIIDKSDILKNSRKLYELIKNDKAEFTLNIIDALISSDSTLKTPSYILKAFNFLLGEVNKNEQI